MELSTSCCT